jgi:hypothetical protein
MFRDSDLIDLLDNLKAKILNSSLSNKERICLVNLQSKLYMLSMDETQFLNSVDLWDCLSLGYILQTVAATNESQTSS